MPEAPAERCRLLTTVERSQTDEGRSRLVIAANERSRNPFFDIELSGLRFENYRRNPIVMWSHGMRETSRPIGRTTSIDYDTSSNQVAAEWEWNDEFDFARGIHDDWDKGFANGASIRWHSFKDEIREDGSLLSVESDLLEWSIVPVPADPDAVRTMARILGFHQGLPVEAHERDVLDIQKHLEPLHELIKEVLQRLEKLEEPLTESPITEPQLTVALQGINRVKESLRVGGQQ